MRLLIVGHFSTVNVRLARTVHTVVDVGLGSPPMANELTELLLRDFVNAGGGVPYDQYCSNGYTLDTVYAYEIATMPCMVHQP